MQQKLSTPGQKASHPKKFSGTKVFPIVFEQALRVLLFVRTTIKYVCGKSPSVRCH